MKDTPPKIEGMARRMLMARSGEERLMMAVQAFESARTMMEASLPRGLSKISGNVKYFDVDREVKPE